MKIRTMLSAAGAGLSVACFAAVDPGFGRIASELDFGGDYFEVVNAATFRSDIVKVLDFVQQGVTESGIVAKKDLEKVRRVRALSEWSGLLAVRGTGTSVMPAKDGSYVHKTFLLTEKGKNPVLDLCACVTRPVSVESFLPRDTGAAVSFSMDVRNTALFAADALDAYKPGSGLIVRMFCTAQQGQPSPVDAFAPGTLLALTFDRNRMWKIPESGLEMPEPGLILVQAVRNGTPWMLLKTSAMAAGGKNGAKCSVTPDPAFPGVERLVFSVPKAKAMNMTPACAYVAENGVIVFASSVRLLDAALAAGVKKEGRLLDDVAFRAHAPKLEAVSGISYLSPTVVPMLADLAHKGLAKEKVPVPPVLRDFLKTPPPVWCTSTFVRLEDGVKGESFSSIGACNALRILTNGSSASSIIGSLGTLSGTLFPAISQARTSAKTSAMAMRGRNLFVAIIMANVERETAGLPSVWPRTKAATDDKGDIAGMTFGNGCDYFNTLFDAAKSGGDKWAPYVSCDLKCIGSDLRPGQRIQAGGIDWCVAANVRDEMDDVVPVLVSANFNPALLLTKWDGRKDAKRVLPIGPESGAAKSLFGDKAIVVVRKGGAAQIIKAKYLTYETLYQRHAFDETVSKGEPLEYLTPTGFVRPLGAR